MEEAASCGKLNVDVRREKRERGQGRKEKAGGSTECVEKVN